MQRHPTKPAGAGESSSQTKTTAKGGGKGRNEGSASTAQASDQTEQESPARRAARELIERSRSLLFDRPDFRPITYKQAGELTKVIFGDSEIDARWDAKIHAFITLLSGITHAHFEVRRGNFKGPDVECLIYEATLRAYAETTHFHDGSKEFADLPLDTYKEVAALYEEELSQKKSGT